jgi:serine/threonine protein kinase
MSDEQEVKSELSAVADEAPGFDDPLVGKVVATRYKVKKKLGEGGMGTVYLAEHITIEKDLALKVLLHEYARKADLKERFLREAKAAASIGHENIIDITDFGETPDGSVFFAMEFLAGRDLSHAIKQDGPFSWQRAKPILLQICRALGAAHSKDIIHRDMKPENIFLIEREGRADFVKVLDFGIAKVSGMSDGERLTRTGMIFGTPEYMSPEQAQGHHPDHRVDIYAVGVIMYELLTGEVPFKADTFMGILTKHIFENPIPPSQVKPDLPIPADAEAIVMKAMTKDREERFNSMTEMASAIQRVSERMVRSTSDHSLAARRMTPAESAVVPTGGRVHNITANPATGSRVVEPIKSLPPGAIGNGRSKVFGIVISAAVLIGGGVAVWALTSGNHKKPPEKTKPKIGVGEVKKPIKPKVAMVEIKLESTPEGATVYKGATEVGKTPTSIKVKKGDRRILFTFKKDGFRDKAEPVAPHADGKKVHVKLESTKVETKVVATKVPTKVAKTDRTDSKAERRRRERERRRRERERRRKERERRLRAAKTKTKKPPAKTKTDNRVDRGDLKNPFQ